MCRHVFAWAAAVLFMAALAEAQTSSDDDDDAVLRAPAGALPASSPECRDESRKRKRVENKRSKADNFEDGPFVVVALLAVAGGLWHAASSGISSLLEERLSENNLPSLATYAERCAYMPAASSMLLGFAVVALWRFGSDQSDMSTSYGASSFAMREALLKHHRHSSKPYAFIEFPFTATAVRCDGPSVYWSDDDLGRDGIRLLMDAQAQAAPRLRLCMWRWLPQQLWNWLGLCRQLCICF
jgi:hypothetical protein